MTDSNNGHSGEDSPPRVSVRTLPIDTEPEDQETPAGRSTRWFAYIAVGITIVSMLAGLALMVAVVYLFFR